MSQVGHCGPWTIILSRTKNAELPWHAHASLNFDDVDADGMDRKQALTSIAEKIGARPEDVLRDFGLQVEDAQS